MEEQKGRIGAAEKAKYMRIIWWLRRHPVHAAYLILGITLSPHQRITFKQMWFASNVGLKLSRGLSKSFLDGLLLTLRLILYKNATQIVLARGFRGGKLVLREACEPMILGSLDGQKHKKYAIRCLTNYRKANKNNALRVINKDPDLWYIDAAHGSDIKTGPLGTEVSKSSQLRGLRANTTLILDEAADIGEELYTSVIRPFARVATNPVAGANKKRETSLTKIESGTVKYDWQRYTKELHHIEKEMINGNQDYALIEFNYEDTFYIKNNKKSSPTGDLREEIKNNNVVFEYRLNLEDISDELKNGETSLEDFMAENKNRILLSTGTEFPSDLLDSITGLEIAPEYADDGDDDPESPYNNSGKFDRLLFPLMRSNDPMVLAIDPARESDEAAFVLVRLGPMRKCKAPFCDVVNAKAFLKAEFKDLYETIVDYYLVRFPNIKLIYMDQGGGGSTLRDMLWRPKAGRTPIYDPNDPDTPEDVRQRGNPILRMGQATAELNTKRVGFVQAQMQAKKMQLPAFEYSSGLRELDEIHRTLRKLRQQFTYIVSSPAGNWKKYSVDSKYKKDLFSATLLAFQGVYDLLYNEVETQICSEYAWVE